jgi:hypothetical protein
MVPPDSSQPASDPERRAWVLGILIGLPLTMAMVEIWRNWDLVGWSWLLLFSFVIAPCLPRKRPTVKMMTIALFVARYLALLIH